MSRLCTGDYAYPISISDCVEFDRIDVNVGISKDCSVVTGFEWIESYWCSCSGYSAIGYREPSNWKT